MVKPGWNRCFNALASLKLAVVLLAVLVVVMAVGTIVETHYGAQVARRVVYGALWFDALLCVLAINVLFSALKRWPWKRVHLGFVATHLGIIILLLGCFINRHFAVEGQIGLAEGETADSFRVEGQSLRVSLPDGSETVLHSNWGSRLFDSPPWNFVLPDGETQVSVTKRMANAVRYRDVSEIATGPGNAAIQFQLRAPSGESFQNWLFADAPSGDSIELTGMRIAFLRCSSDLQLQRELKASPPIESSSGIGQLHIMMTDGLKQVIDVDSALGSDPVAIKDSTWSVRIVEYMPDMKMVGGKMTNIGSQPDNPMLRVHMVSTSGASEEHITFANFPDFTSMHGRERQGSGVKFRFTSAHKAPRSKDELLVLLMPDGSFNAIVKALNANPQSSRMEIGQTLKTPWSGITFTLQKYFARAKVEHKWTEAQGEEGVAALAFTVDRGTTQATGVAGLGQGPVSVALDNEQMQVSLEARHTKLGFKLKLLDFSNPKYGGTAMDARYQSKVMVVDEKGSDKYTISMNQPLDRGRYRLFQSSFIDGPEGEQVSIISVAYNPGTAVIYWGSLIMTIGIMLIFYLPKGNKLSSSELETVT
jgi:ResB-like family